MDSAAWAATFAGVSALGAVTTAVIAAWSLKGSRDDSRERSRPVIVAELQRNPLTHGAQSLIVRNYGASVAKDVSVKFDPALPDPDDSESAGKITPFMALPR